ncbi:hypothetical protein LPB260_22145 [Pseudomonas sp. LPB0260]|uniref:hypothetical protein n=1 Tax=Pseudomonas sp. LPB0260 TaxID=2614442 RepID=UPI0015C1F200|nr:hypothetical protein [Pseudomonas sp. LPB0260]QLC73437.1 hypothetical protein LPB260_07195 [Pseudomonas sp. LPB0260]QLC76211.1 hypothetical protein LPB260_22145 [Pseudomonas sp. LPB0260]
MRGSRPEDGQHSTSDSGERPRPWLKVIASLALFGFLIGLMIGRLLQPAELRLGEVVATEQGLQLWFNERPEVRAGHFQGAFVLRVATLGREQQGQLRLNGRLVSWRLQRERRELLLRVVAARPLRGEWHAEQVDGRWRLTVRLEEQ